MRRHSSWTVSFILLVLLGLSGHATAAPRPPLFFEVNQGQTDPQVRFLARSGGYTLLLTPTEAVLALKGPAAVRMKLAGDANAAPEVVGEDPLEGRVHYLRGNDPSRWRRNVPTYGRVRYRAVYPGIDLVFYGKDRGLEYDFIVAPGMDPGAIRLLFEGAEWSSSTGATWSSARPPAACGCRGPCCTRTPTALVARCPAATGWRVGTSASPSGHTIRSVRRVRHRPDAGLLDVPGREWLRQRREDCVDAAGSVYVVGTAPSADFPTTPGTIQPAKSGGTDAFVAEGSAPTARPSCTRPISAAMARTRAGASRWTPPATLT